MSEDQKIIDSIKRMLVSKMADDQKIAASLFMEHFKGFDPNRDLSFIQDSILDESITDSSWQVFLEELAQLILAKDKKPEETTEEESAN